MAQKLIFDDKRRARHCPPNGKKKKQQQTNIDGLWYEDRKLD